MRIKRSHFVGSLIVATAVALAAPPAGALGSQGRGRGPAKAAEKGDKHADKHAGKHADKTAKHDAKSTAKHTAVVVDRDGHVRVIRDYGRSGSLPPGLAKRESLPPGLRQQLRERGTLPPGLRRHLIPVEGQFVTRLPRLPTHYTRYFVGDDLIVVDTRSNLVVTIIRDVWG